MSFRSAGLRISVGLCASFAFAALTAVADFAFHDSHFHLTNYVQERPTLNEFLKNGMGDRVGRVALFGIPLQQTWSYENSGDFAPTYYLQTDEPLYYYWFTDAVIATAYRSLSKREQARFDPVITGFNPAGMDGRDPTRRGRRRGRPSGVPGIARSSPKFWPTRRCATCASTSPGTRWPNI